MAEVRKISNVTVNDGKGLYDNDGLIDTMIVDCNKAVQQCITGRYIGFCKTMVDLVQKLANVREGFKKEMKAKDEVIADLRRLNNDLAEKVTGLPADRSEEKQS